MSSLDGEPDDELLRLSRREPEAFGVFYRRHEREVIAYMLRRTRDRELAADLTAETFAAALLSVGRYRRRPESAVAWLFGIARNVLARSLERQRVDDRARRRLGMAPLVFGDEQLEALDGVLADVRVSRLLEELPADQAEAVSARVLGDEPYADIAARLRCSESVVRKRVSRGLAGLRPRLKEAE